MAKSKSYRKQVEKREKKKSDKQQESVPGIVIKAKYLTYGILLVLFMFSFYIRGITPIQNTFSRGLVAFASDDAVFHMRLVENTIQFFPHRIFYDAFTYYPYGSHLHWGPLFDQMIAFFALLAGFLVNGGLPAQSTIDTVGAFYPAVLGALVVFPVFFIGKELTGNKAGLIGAFLISISPGQFTDRSILGFTDNHIAEVFYLAMMMMFFVMAIKRAENIAFEQWLKKDIAVIKIPLAYSIIAGIFFGAYLLNWTNGVFFAVVFGIFVIVQYIIDHFKGKPTEYIGVVGTIAYLVAMIMVLQYVDINNGFSSGYYSFLHLTVTGGGAVLFVFLTLVSREMNRRRFSGYHYLLFVIGSVLFLLIFIKLALPGLYNSTIGTWDFIFKPHTGGGLTIGEAMPFMRDFTGYYEGIEYNLMYLGIPVGIYATSILGFVLGRFGYNYYLAFIAIIVLCYYIVRKPKAEYTLITVWSVFVLAILLAQDRFAYYYSVNVAILSGFLCSVLLDKVDWNSLDSDDILENMKKIKVQQILMLIILIAVIGFFPFDNSPYKNTMERAVWGSANTGVGYYEWHDALTWMRDHTPDPGLDYYAIYTKPKNGTYPYPETAYGVMSWWDYGHVITYWGHRIPNANPFQSGIGGGPTHAPGASTFLTAQTEEQANAVLDKLGINGKPGARYVISDAYMAYSILTVYPQWDEQSTNDYFSAIQSSKGTLTVPSTKYLNTIEAKLHIFDGANLRYYRMVHESNVNPQTLGGAYEVGVYMDQGKLYPLCDRNNFCVGKYWINQVYQTNLTMEYSGYIKIFEYVKGARIEGRAPPNTTVRISNTIITNIGRKIPYSQTTKSSLDGTYAFTVPYSTQGVPLPNETQFDTKPEGPYTVSAGNYSKPVDVSEKDVLQGNTVILNLA
ncbi:MAG TPA: oligosaccharyl transferase, archaeosortase A system-associated [Candidatus Methanoperedens sp.]